LPNFFLFGSFFLCLFLSLSSSVYASTVNIDNSGEANAAFINLKSDDTSLSLSTGQKSGHITYQIGGTYTDGVAIYVRPFPTSELAFPLNINVSEIRYSFRLNPKLIASLSHQWGISQYAGKMEDSDWGIAPFSNDPNSLDIFSKSDSQLNFNQTSLHIKNRPSKKRNYQFITQWNMQLGLLIDVENYDYSASNLVQYYPSTGLEPVTDAREVITYDVLKMASYLTASFTTPRKNRFTASIDLGFSPLMYISDHDNHILRDKTSIGKTYGWSLYKKTQLAWNVSERTHVFINWSSEFSKSNGWQTQYFTPTGDKLFEIRIKHISQQNDIQIGFKIDI